MTRVCPGYEKEYCKKAKKLEVYFYAPHEKIRGHMNGWSPKEVIEYYEKIDKCKCGGTPKVMDSVFMGDCDTSIVCMSCGRAITRSMYDYDVKKPMEWRELCVRDWNNGLSNADVKAKADAAWEKKRLREEDLIWKPLYPDNALGNGEEGLYCLLFKKWYNEGIFCCKCTIQYQFEEIKPGHISSDPKIEAYILYQRRFFDVEGPWEYPEPCERPEDEENRTLLASGVNDYGNFVRAYKTLEEAKEGALHRSIMEGLNRETIINPD